MKILLIDRNEKFRENLKLYIEGHLNHKVVCAVPDEMSLSSSTNIKADIVLVDVKSPYQSDHLKNLCYNFDREGCCTIAISQHKEFSNIEILRGAGFKGFVSKENLFRDLESAINAVTNGSQFFCNESHN